MIISKHKLYKYVKNNMSICYFEVYYNFTYIIYQYLKDNFRCKIMILYKFLIY